MKLIVVLAAAAAMAMLTAATPASAQKDPACIEKCMREKAPIGAGATARKRACFADCPKAKSGGKSK